jgi:predicted PhzF superfamily epimerase YddE/YHI9
MHVDAFTDRPFGGNPAAVCLLDAPRPDDWLQAVAAEMNLSETAFLLRRADGFDLRWFTPTVEVPLCGHATLASAHALWERRDVALDAVVRFHTKSGLLSAERAPPDLDDVLGVSAEWRGRSPVCHVFELESEAALRGLQPDPRRLARSSALAVAVTARASSPGADFVSRFFAPAQGVDEDPVTGAAHCCLGPYWAERLGKSTVVGYQASARGGVVRVEVVGPGVKAGRLRLLGQAVTVFRGTLQ